jgi:hypothetical protein
LKVVLAAVTVRVVATGGAVESFPHVGRRIRRKAAKT